MKNQFERYELKNEWAKLFCGELFFPGIQAQCMNELKVISAGELGKLTILPVIDESQELLIPRIVWRWNSSFIKIGTFDS